ncbi:MAG: hypothetical protein P8N31_08500 [Planctomycetota bacterium]|nr:hypothetical protein [Planctomycetota bacterium]
MPIPGSKVDITTIQAAIDTAVDVDLIVVADGAHQEHQHTEGKFISLTGQVNPSLYLSEFAAGD